MLGETTNTDNLDLVLKSLSHLALQEKFATSEKRLSVGLVQELTIPLHSRLKDMPTLGAGKTEYSLVTEMQSRQPLKANYHVLA